MTLLGLSAMFLATAFGIRRMGLKARSCSRHSRRVGRVASALGFGCVVFAGLLAGTAALLALQP